MDSTKPTVNEDMPPETILEDISNKNSRSSRGPKQSTQAKSRSRLGPGITAAPGGGGDVPEVEAMRCSNPVGTASSGSHAPELEALWCSEPVGSSSGGSHILEVEALSCSDPAGVSGHGSNPGEVRPPEQSHGESLVHSIEPAGGRRLLRAVLPHHWEGNYPVVEVLRGSTRGPTTRSTRNRYDILARSVIKKNITKRRKRKTY
jgi:hypothetical protein